MTTGYEVVRSIGRTESEVVVHATADSFSVTKTGVMVLCVGGEAVSAYAPGDWCEIHNRTMLPTLAP